MSTSEIKAGQPPAAPKPSREDRVYKILGIFFYLFVAVGVVYHLLNPL
ncbi:MAG: hypothetical protein GWM98_03575 [Nitrospinaceae bacterium]|nr:hypothetical protein [Nitrospinaceae bacterium]NIS84164.1 hypothetical protein [Nitrospinaceae bacterium]NIT80967.1 hypothetical protein [Nitrospinaceae bacterium]NIU95361.1 hypothetical protein [Nitrospinaceae bacterium]NIY14015.1 hypothetical protein [Nitrospinaceae bacterium]